MTTVENVSKKKKKTRTAKIETKLQYKTAKYFLLQKLSRKKYRKKKGISINILLARK
jgi:hypothetical protein